MPRLTMTDGERGDMDRRTEPCPLCTERPARDGQLLCKTCYDAGQDVADRLSGGMGPNDTRLAKNDAIT